MQRFVHRDRILRVDRVFKRFDAIQRIEHGVLLLAVFVLLNTGLPQKYAHLDTSAALIRWLGGIQNVRLAHRAAAIVLVAEAVFHILNTLHRFLVLRLRPHALLLPRDFRDLWHGINFRLGREEEPPDMGRFTYQEKILYWLVVWSIIMLSITGFMLWKPVLVTRLFPGQSIPAAKVMHGNEALFLLLFGVVWHIWHTVIRQGNWSIFTGSISEKLMLHEHPKEWKAIMDGKDRLPLDADRVLYRRRRFAVISVLISIGLTVGLYLFLNSRPTAIVTREERQVQVDPAAGLPGAEPTPTPEVLTPTWAEVQPLLVTNCAGCHGRGDEEILLTDYDALLDSGAVIPGDLPNSSLMAVMSGDHPAKLPQDALALIAVWIDQGATP